MTDTTHFKQLWFGFWFDLIAMLADQQLTSVSPLSVDSREKKSPAMPGSPVDAKTHSRSAPSSSVSSTMPPLPSVNPSGPRPASFSTTACKGHSCIPIVRCKPFWYFSCRFHLKVHIDRLVCRCVWTFTRLQMVSLFTQLGFSAS